MKTAIEPTARNSDCQFWSVRSQKSGDTTYAPHEIETPSLLPVVAPVVERLRGPGGEEDGRHHQQQRLLVDSRDGVVPAGDRRAVGRCEAADPLGSVVLEAGFVDVGRRRRASLDEPHRREHEQGELEELGLPVLHHRSAEGRRGDVLPPARAGCAVGACARRRSPASPPATARRARPRTAPRRGATGRCRGRSASSAEEPDQRERDREADDRDDVDREHDAHRSTTALDPRARVPRSEPRREARAGLPPADRGPAGGSWDTAAQTAASCFAPRASRLPTVSTALSAFFSCLRFSSSSRAHSVSPRPRASAIMPV